MRQNISAVYHSVIDGGGSSRRGYIYGMVLKYTIILIEVLGEVMMKIYTRMVYTCNIPI